MEKISLWCKSIALVSVISSLIMFVVPEGSCKKAFRTLFSFIMIYTVVSPLIGQKPDFSFIKDYSEYKTEYNISDTSEKYDYNPLVSAAESETEKYFASLLDEIGSEGYCEVTYDLESEKLKICEIRFFDVTDYEHKSFLKKETEKIFHDDVIILFSGEQQ